MDKTVQNEQHQTAQQGAPRKLYAIQKVDAIILTSDFFDQSTIATLLDQDLLVQDYRSFFALLTNRSQREAYLKESSTFNSNAQA